MKHREMPIFALDNFEGPLDFLLHLIQKSEIEINEITIHKITEQFLKGFDAESSHAIEVGAEFIGVTAALLLLKSRMLLPTHEQQVTTESEELDPHFEIIHQLIDYNRFKDAAKLLCQREEKQHSFFSRGVDPTREQIKSPGMEHLTLQDLATLFQQVLTKAKSQTGIIEEERWKVSDKINWLRIFLKNANRVDFFILFSPETSKEEMIVLFLAILEMMKLGELSVAKDISNEQIVLIGKEAHE